MADNISKLIHAGTSLLSIGVVLVIPYVKYRIVLRTAKYSETTKPVFRLPRLSKFLAVIFSIHAVFSYMVFGRNMALLPAWAHNLLQLSVYVQWLVIGLSQKLMPLWFRLLVSWPAYWYFASTWFGSAFLPLHLIQSVPSWVAPATGMILGGIGMYQSLADPRFCGEVVNIDLTEDRAAYPETQANKTVKRIANKAPKDSKVLNVFQITDSHLGPFMSAERMFRICTKIANDPNIDLVVITGDLETIGSHNSEEALGRSFKPLKSIKGKVFACLGNHDYETLDRVRRALADNDVVLLEDEEAIVDTRVGPVQIIGSIFTFSGTEGSERHIVELCQKYSRRANVPRIMLIHNPSVFPMIPHGEVDIQFSGHYHGGQISLFGIVTFMELFVAMRHLFYKWKGQRDTRQFPDNGLYCLGKNRLYAHRGTGHYGFPLRLGVPSEQSLIRLHFSP